MSNFTKKSSLCPTNGRQTVGDGAVTFDNKPSVLAVCQLQGTDIKYSYSTFSGGPGKNALQTEGSPASIFSNDSGSISSSPESIPFSKSIIYPRSSAPITTISYSDFPSTGSSPRTIPHRNGSHNSYSSTPSLTPDCGSDFSTKTQSHIYPKRERDALDFLMTVFPHQGFGALPHAKGVSISAPSLGADFNGVVLELPGKPKILYVDGKSAATVNLRESIVALLELADESLECDGLVIVLERTSSNLGGLLHSLMYVGGSVVTSPPFKVNPAFVLVGLEV
ncbi:hypothetical protein K443DRAFT_131323 [Laccaria amethystina LaAM-08-1]|uniref:Ornithine decarboxylase antizyme n=1 Tax=Laccaria amethystina LaAM-08-1 TaxID=1095629 RepID=A0A0C9Y0M0_9AGAR|nr:hypothetical protein K443DRAFT_131323 [Laccaria amethystina LaAM-08-1]